MKTERHLNVTSQAQAEMFKASWSADQWADHAKGLLGAAEFMFNSYEDAHLIDESGPRHPDRLHFNRPAMLLLALALENALKARLIQDKGVTVEQARKEWKGTTGHQSDVLASKLGLNLDESEKRIFKHLSRYAIWAGKYPSAFTENEFICDDQPTRISGWCPLSLSREQVLMVERRILELTRPIYDASCQQIGLKSFTKASQR